MAEFAAVPGTPMKPSKGEDLEHPVTDLEAVRSILVQGLPLLDQELTESSIVQVFSAYGEISKLLLQTNEESRTQRAVLVFADVAGATSALQANGRDILGANCSVSLASSMPALNDGLDRDNVSDQPAAMGGMEGRTLTTAEWIKGIFAQGMVYTRLFDEKLGVSSTAKSIAAKVQTQVEQIDEKHNVSGKLAAVAFTAQSKVQEVNTKLKVSETASKWAHSAKESTDKALESNPRVAAGVHQAGDAIGSLVKSVSGLAHQAMGQPQEMAGPSPPSAGPANTAGGTFGISESDTSAGALPTKPV
ncbi:unnamed protein product [Ectocarpus sp. 4 AP-2014]